VTDGGCLQGRWHAALYDVGTGAMVRGPEGAFTPLAAPQGDDRRSGAEDVPVEVRGGASWLVG
jgi:nitrite reductase/ring-hydroxylating ferredoxin subunit